MSRSFLENVAHDLWQSYGSGIANITILLPSRRAGLFFRDALAAEIDVPLWSPQQTSINQITEQLSGLKVGDRIRMVAELFKIYRQYHPNEKFDSFYFWGEILIGDFDTIDKYMINADMLFCNLADLHDLDNFHTLPESQMRLIEEFWTNIDNEIDTYAHKQRFCNIWRTLAPIYHQFRQRLEQMGIGYSGMIYRKAAEMVASGVETILDSKHYAVIGMNALSTSEVQILKYLKSNYKVDFYWDYDNYYVNNKDNEAGMFLRKNIELFPAKTTFDTDRLCQPKEICVVSTPSDAVQCKYVGNMLSQMGEVGKDTAVILTDESLLMPMLYALPSTISNVNVTMGYPIRTDIAYSFCERLIELQQRLKEVKGEHLFYHSDVTGLLSHAYLSSIPDVRELIKEINNRHMIYVPQALFDGRAVLSDIFTPQSGIKQKCEYIKRALDRVMRECTKDVVRDEIFHIIATQIDKLSNSVDACGLPIEESTYMTLLRRVLQGTTIPFEGEPLVGVQMMGFLESRTLDFRNVVIVSMSDDHCPGGRNASPSYIPYKLRKAYEMPTNEEQEAMYAYYFYRLLQRAERVDLVYCSKADEKNTGERSRYISQLIYESNHKINEVDVRLEVSGEQVKPISVEKSGAVAEKLNEWLDNPQKMLSHSRFFKFIECPLKFYFDSIAGLKPVEELSEEIDGSVFGNIIHYSMEELYKPFVGKHNPSQDIDALIGSSKVRDVVTKAVNKAYLHRKDCLDTDDWGGTLRMIRNVAIRYINANILPFDRAKEGYTIEEVEAPREMPFEIELNGTKHQVWFNGKVDRIDRLDDGTIEVVDYKTSRRYKEEANDKIASISALFDNSGDGVISAVLQTLLYSDILTRQNPEATVRPLLYYIRKMQNNYSPLIVDKERKANITSYQEYAEEFRKLFGDALGRLFDTTQPFTQVADDKACTYCDFKILCGRQSKKK